MPKPLHLIVACSENLVIGRNGKLPWRISEDSNFFHNKTHNQIVVLGRVCFETWPRAALGGRRPVVITRKTSLANDVVRTVPSLDAAIAVADTLPGEIFICGGQRIYQEALVMAEKPTRPFRLHLTLVHAEVSGDTFFPEWRHLTWRELSRRESRDSNYRYTFFDFERA